MFIKLLNESTVEDILFVFKQDRCSNKTGVLISKFVTGTGSITCFYAAEFVANK